jgi:hypothetical protein
VTARKATPGKRGPKVKIDAALVALIAAATAGEVVSLKVQRLALATMEDPPSLGMTAIAVKTRERRARLLAAAAAVKPRTKRRRVGDAGPPLPAVPLTERERRLLVAMDTPPAGEPPTVRELCIRLAGGDIAKGQALAMQYWRARERQAKDLSRNVSAVAAALRQKV